MSMLPDTDTFEKLRQLLTLKRYEQPPPGYFYHFSGSVIARIKDGERGEDTVSYKLFNWQDNWLGRLWTSLESRPALTGAFGILICGFFLTGIVLSENGEAAYVNETSPAPSLNATVAANQEHQVQARLFNAEGSGSILAHTELMNAGYTNGVALANSLFDSIRPQPKFIGWPGNN